MHLQPSPTWYLYTADGAAPLRLLDDEGRAEPALSGTPHGVLAELAEAIHAPAATSPKPSCATWSCLSRCNAGAAEFEACGRVQAGRQAVSSPTK